VRPHPPSMATTQISKKRKFVADGVFYAELNEMLMRELAEDGYSGVEVRVTPMRTEIIIRATRTQSVLGEKGRRIRELTGLVQKRWQFAEGSVELYAEKVANRGLCAVAQCESLRYKLIGGLAAMPLDDEPDEPAEPARARTPAAASSPREPRSVRATARSSATSSRAHGRTTGMSRSAASATNTDSDTGRARSETTATTNSTELRSGRTTARSGAPSSSVGASLTDRSDAFRSAGRSEGGADSQ